MCPSTTLKQRFAEFPKAFRNFKSDVSLTNVQRIQILRSQWDSETRPIIVVSGWYLFYRIIFSMYFVVGISLSLTSNSKLGYWLLFETNWSFLYQLFYALASAGNTLLFWYQERFSPNHPYSHVKINRFESIIWFFQASSYILSVVVSIGYWVLLYGKTGDNTGFVSILASLVVHGFNGFLSLIDVLVVAMPVRVTHFVYPVALTLLYQMFSILYAIAGGSYPDPSRSYLYPMVDWFGNPGITSVTMLGTCFAATALHFLFWVLFVFRQHLADKYIQQNYYDKETSEEPETKRLTSHER